MLALSLRRRASRAFAGAYARVVAEDNERKLAERALRESEQRFQALVHQASDVFTVVDTDGRIRYQSPAIEPVLGYPADHLLGAEMDSLVHTDDQQAFHDLLGKSLARPSASVVGELRMRPHADPQASRRFEMTITNLLHDQTVGGLVLNYRDITERALYTGAAHPAGLRGSPHGPAQPGAAGRAAGLRAGAARVLDRPALC